MRRAIFAMGTAFLFVVLGCAKSAEPGDFVPPEPAGVTYRTTTRYYFGTGRVDTASATQYLMSSADLSAFQNQASVIQATGNGFIYGTVKDANGFAIFGVQIEALNNGGVAVGTPVYRVGGGDFDPLLTQTGSAGEFIIFNVAPGRVNLRCKAGASGNIYVKAVADETTLVNMVVSAGFSTVTWSGQTLELQNVPVAAVASVTVTKIGIGGVLTVTSNATGDFNLGTVRASNEHLLKLSALGYLDTYNQFNTGTSTLTTGTGDLLIVASPPAMPNFMPASVTWTAGTGIIRGELTPPAGGPDGYTIACTDLTGVAVGDIRYGDGSNIPNDALTATQPGGVFYIYNVPAGTVFVRATKAGFGASTYVETFADSVTLIQGQLSPTGISGGADTIALSGSVFPLTDSFTVRSASVERIGEAVTVTTNEAGFYSMSAVPANHKFLIKTSKP